MKKNTNLKWSREEEEALIAGVAKHGRQWRIILTDPEFTPILICRSNIDLKDKWRNMNASPGAQGRQGRSQTPNPNTILDGTALPSPNTESSSLSEDVAAGNSSKKPTSRSMIWLDKMVLEALSAFNEQNGTDKNAILSYIEEQYDVTPCFKKTLTGRLRKLVAQDRVERVENFYRIKEDVPFVSRVRKEEATSAVQTIAEAENKSYSVAVAVREAERVEEMAEDAYLFLDFVKELSDRCAREEIREKDGFENKK